MRISARAFVTLASHDSLLFSALPAFETLVSGSQLKSHEISGQMFDNEYDLAKAVMAGMESRSIAGEYALDRFIFNCA
jgi:hypothetical protein